MLSLILIVCRSGWSSPAGQATDALYLKVTERSEARAILLADKAYDTDAIGNFAKQRKCWANIPAKANRKQIFSFKRWVYSSITSNRGATWQHDTIDVPTTTLWRSSSLRQGCGLPQIMIPFPNSVLEKPAAG